MWKDCQGGAGMMSAEVDRAQINCAFMAFIFYSVCLWMVVNGKEVEEKRNMWKTFNLRASSSFQVLLLYCASAHVCQEVPSFKWRFSLDLVYHLKTGWSWSVFSLNRATVHAIFLTFISRCNETQGKVDPGVIILYNIPGGSLQKVILAVGKYQYQEQGRKSEC